MIELVWGYGLWLVLAAVFLTMHWFGKKSCCRAEHGHTTPSVRPRASEDEPDSRGMVKKVKE